MHDCIDNGSAHTTRGYKVIMRGGLNYRLNRLICALTHNLAYEDNTWVARHTCDNPRCIRVEHLVPGTSKDNSRDALQRGQFPMGERHGRSTLTDTQVADIRADPRSHRMIAAEYGVSSTTVGNYKKGSVRNAVQ